MRNAFPSCLTRPEVHEIKSPFQYNCGTPSPGEEPKTGLPAQRPPYGLKGLQPAAGLRRSSTGPSPKPLALGSHEGSGHYRGSGRLSMGGTWNVIVKASRGTEEIGRMNFSVIAT